MTLSKTHPIKWMSGMPQVGNETIRFADGSYYKYPQLKWTFSNIQQLVPTKTAWRGSAKAQSLAQEPADLGKLNFRTEMGETISWHDAHAKSETDSIGVLHRGKLISESYFGFAHAHKPHLIQSCAKSFVGLMAEMMIEAGDLDEDELIPHYLPELSDSAWSHARVRDVLDMQTNMRFYENYLDPASDVWQMLRAAGMIPTPPGQPVTGFTDFLPTVKSAGPCGKVFAYREPNIFVLNWLLSRLQGKHLNEQLSERIWQHIGAEHDALYMVDPNGFCATAAVTLRDYLRFGEVVRTGGNGLISERVRASIFGGGDRKKFAAAKMEGLEGWSYRSQFWMRHHEGRIIATARGAHGQILYIDPEKELVIARFGSPKLPTGSQHYHILMPLFDAITKEVAG